MVEDVKAFPPYSVLMSVYIKENPLFLRQAIESMLNQSVKPSQIVLVEDGPLTQELYAVLDEFAQSYPQEFCRVKNETNLGLGNALNKGLERCTCELVARMDTDDISKPDRCEKQLKAFMQDDALDMVGGNIEEFYDSVDEVVSQRIVPTSHEEICDFMKKRNPFNHPSVMYKKQAVVNAGNYIELYLYEDYYLWVRMYLNGCKFANVGESLVSMRISNQSARRGGYKYYKSEKTLFKFMRKSKMIGLGAYLAAICKRFVARVLIPNKIRQWAYKKYVRKSSK